MMSTKITDAPSTKPPAVIGRESASLTGACAAPVLIPDCWPDCWEAACCERLAFSAGSCCDHPCEMSVRKKSESEPIRRIETAGFLENFLIIPMERERASACYFRMEGLAEGIFLRKDEAGAEKRMRTEEPSGDRRSRQQEIHEVVIAGIWNNTAR